MAKKSMPTEAKRILTKTSDKERLIGLKKINEDDESRNALLGLLSEIFTNANNNIIRSAGVPNSMDEVIGISVSQAFQKGRISAAVLVNTIIKKSGEELERRESKK